MIKKPSCGVLLIVIALLAAVFMLGACTSETPSRLCPNSTIKASDVDTSSAKHSILSPTPFQSFGIVPQKLLVSATPATTRCLGSSRYFSSFERRLSEWHRAISERSYR